MQDNEETMDAKLARMCLEAGMRMWLGARDCPPPRVGALAGIHKYDKIDGVECIVCG